MNCANSNSPINISSSDNIQICNIYCSYNHKYNDSSCTATYNSNFVQLSYDTGSVPPVTFNDEQYNVRTIYIFSPSIHTYNGTTADAEMLIFHDGAGKKLIVSVPLVSSNNSTAQSSTILYEIMSTFSNVVNVSTSNDSQLINVANYNLEYFIPNSPYYFYTGGSPFSPCDNTYSFIVFDQTKSPVSISSATLGILQKLISPSGISPVIRLDYYYHSTPPNGSNPGADDKIYIECNPTDDSGESMYQPDTTSSSLMPLPDIDLMNSPILNLIVGIGLSYAFLKMVSKVL